MSTMKTKELLPKAARKNTLKEIMAENGISILQLSKVSGISNTQVHRALYEPNDHELETLTQSVKKILTDRKEKQKEIQKGLETISSMTKKDLVTPSVAEEPST